MCRKVYDRQFKMVAVQLVLEENIFVKVELSIHSNTPYRWISEYEELRKELDLLKRFQIFLKKKNVEDFNIEKKINTNITSRRLVKH
ncbi:hypothetical protein P4530_03230 [Bacillus thuringiensis]|nr:hypothetical protein [Bacillus thuringiensis]